MYKVFSKYTRKITDMYTRASHLSLLRGESLHTVFIKSVSKWPLPSFVLYSLLTPWSRVLQKLTGFQLVEKFPAFYGTRRFFTAFTNAQHLSLSWASSIKSIISIPYFLQLHLKIILPSMPMSPKWSLSLRFCLTPSKNFYEFFFTPMTNVCYTHLTELMYVTPISLN